MSRIKYVLVGENNDMFEKSISKNEYFFKISFFCLIVFVVAFFCYASNNDRFGRYYFYSSPEFKDNTVHTTTQPGTQQSTIATITIAKTHIATTYMETTILETTAASTKAATESPRNRTPLAITKPTFLAATTSTHLLNKSNYYVLTSQCRIPYVDPFTPELQKIFVPGKPASCSSDRAIVTSIYNVSTRQYTLHINTKNANGTEEDVSCCYRRINRAGRGSSADTSYRLFWCINFQQDFVVPTNIDAMIVDCNSSSKKFVQQDALSFIHYKKITTSSAGDNNSIPPKRKPSILLIGIDSLSRMNFRRNMPNTFKYMANNSNWIELEGYNKMGDNTFPNLMAILTGYNQTFAFSKCNPRQVGGLDSESCNMIWNTFTKFGYRTAYAEDTSKISTFNYLKKGFKQQPTDYYLRPMMLAIEKEMNVEEKYTLPFCIGRKQYGEYIYDFAQQFAKVYKEEPIFGLFWANSFTHGSFDSASTMDNRMLEYLKSFAKDGILESSIVVLFSDHGTRWGPLLSLPEGFLEERLPMFFISLPTWFRKEYPNFVEALKVNRHRLTSPYDIHMTLKHIMELGSDSEEKLPVSSGCKKCQSIFHVIPENRTCTDAGIIEHWCTCVPYQIIPNSSSIAKNVTKLIIEEMNKYLEMKNMSSVCSTLSLKTVEEAQLKMAHHDTATELPTYRLTYLTNPEVGSFQATAIYDPLKKVVKVEVEDDISRLSLYASTSKCISDKQAKKYCICNTGAKRASASHITHLLLAVLLATKFQRQ